MAKFNYNLKKRNSTKPTLIQLIIRWDKKKVIYSAQESILPKYWETDSKKKNFQRAKETREFSEFRELNVRLDWLMSEAKSAFRKFLNDNNNASPTPEQVKDFLNVRLRNSEAKQKMTFFEFAKIYINEASTRTNQHTGKPISNSTIKIYKHTISSLKEFSVTKKTRIDFDTIDLNFYHQYVDYLAREKDNCTNSVGRHIKTIKSILNDATERGFNNNLAFKSKKFRKITEDVDNIYLNDSLVEEMFKLDLSDNLRLQHVRDLFIVGCCTGLRFSDFTNIKSENFEQNFIKIKTVKTNENLAVPIRDEVKLILERYKGVYPNSLPPTISNQKMNAYLKEIGKMITSLHEKVTTSSSKGGVITYKQIEKYKLVMTHTARRSFATNLYKSGFPSINIMKITGHRTEKAFMRYIKITPEENAKILQEYWEKLGKAS